jgi:glyoxylase-like metal-dependent hydrolase (beta-lactamase superfamily II)
MKLMAGLIAVALAAAAISAQQPAGAGRDGQQVGAGQGGGQGAGRGGPPPAPPAIKQVKPGVFMITGLGGNTTVRVGKDAIILVDTKNRGDENYKQLMDLVKMASPAPVKYVFITHHHQDHSGNIGNFQAAGSEVIVHEGLNKNLQTYDPPQGKPTPAKVTYAKDRKVKVGGAQAVGYHFGRAHTGGDTVVYFPDVKVVSTGDVFVANAPNVDFPFGGSLTEYSTVLASILKLDFDMAIPGHGNDPMTKADVQAFKTKIDTIISRGRELVAKGTPKDQLMAQLKTDDLGWNLNTPQWTQAARLDPMYAELSKK